MDILPGLVFDVHVEKYIWGNHPNSWTVLQKQTKPVYFLIIQQNPPETANKPNWSPIFNQFSSPVNP